MTEPTPSRRRFGGPSLGLLIALAAACGPTPPDDRSEPTPAVSDATDDEPATAEPTVSKPSDEDPGDASAAVSDAAGTDLPWIDTRGTSLLGFGLLRLVPPPGGATYRIDYEEEAHTYSTASDLQLFVLPFDSFAHSDMVYADSFLTFTRTDPGDAPPEVAGGSSSGYYSQEGHSDDRLHCDVEFTVAEETVVIVAYGPWTGPDTGRPADDEPVFDLQVGSDDPRAAHAWIESEAGELITTNWTNRPEVARGGPCHDPITDGPLWIEVRPLILYDGRLARSVEEEPTVDLGTTPEIERLLAEADELEAAGETALALDRRERAADLRAIAGRRDTRLVLTPTLTERFRRVPIRWR